MLNQQDYAHRLTIIDLLQSKTADLIRKFQADNSCDEIIEGAIKMAEKKEVFFKAVGSGRLSDERIQAYIASLLLFAMSHFAGEKLKEEARADELETIRN